MDFADIFSLGYILGIATALILLKLILKKKI